MLLYELSLAVSEHKDGQWKLEVLISIGVADPLVEELDWHLMIRGEGIAADPFETRI